MAKKMKKVLAMLLVLVLCAGQIAVPAIAADTPPQNVSVDVDLSQYSQIPQATEDLTVEEQPPVDSTAHDQDAGEIVDTTATTTSWSGTDADGAAVSGSETSETYTGTDDFTGNPLYEGGSVSGSETTVTTTTSTETETDTTVTQTITTTIDQQSNTSGGTLTNTETKTTTEEGQWDTSGEVTEGTPTEDRAAYEKTTSSETNPIGSEEIPEEGITIVLTPDTSTQNPNDFIGVAEGEVIPVEELLDIPEGAELVYNDDNQLIGYRFTRSSREITESNEINGNPTATAGTMDMDGSTSVVTPDLNHALGVTIDDNSVIEEERGDSEDQDKITAYVITNTRESTSTVSGIDALSRPADGSTTKEDGSVETVATEDITDEDGNVVGFISRTIVKDSDGNVLQDTTVTQTIIKPDPPTAAEPVITFTLPEKPAGSDTTDEDGIRTSVTVEEILDEVTGDVIGYRSITVKTDEDGTELFRGTEDIYGTETTVEESLTVDDPRPSGETKVKTVVTDTYRVTAKETIYEDISTYNRLTNIVNHIEEDTYFETVEIDGKLYFLYRGAMTVSEGEDHGDVSQMIPITPDSKLYTASSKNDLEAGGATHISDSDPDDGFQYMGRGIVPSLSVNKASGSTRPSQFRLKASDGKIYFALCVDYDVNIRTGHLYDIEDIEQAEYLKDETAKKLRSIALNGYWGTTSGVGSMDDVQELLINYLIEEENMLRSDAEDIADSLTPGQALTATQAALWKYGDSNANNPVNENNLVANTDGVDETNTKHLYKALIHSANDPSAELEEDEGVPFLDAADISGGAITIKSKVSTDAESAEPDVYNTDLSFTLDIEPAKLNGDLIVDVLVGGASVKKVRLAGNDDPLLPMGRIIQNEDGSYTIPDVELTEGVSVNLNLSGTQELGTGVYIFTSLDGNFSDSQTLITLASGQRKVNLDMYMNFTVEEPTATKSTTEEHREFIRVDSRNDTRTDVTYTTETRTTTDWSQKTHEVQESEVIYQADVTIERLTTEVTTETESWFASWLNVFPPDPVEYDDENEIPEKEEDEEEPGDETPEEPKEGDPGLVEILDEDVPLAAAPKTGDASLLLAALSLTSLGGVFLLNRKRKED